MMLFFMVVQDLSKGQDNLLGLLLVLKTHFAEDDDCQGLKTLTWDKLDTWRLTALGLTAGNVDGGDGSVVRNLRCNY